MFSRRAGRSSLLLSWAILAGCKGDDAATPPVEQPPIDAGTDASPPRPRSAPVAPVFIGSGGFGFAVGSGFAGAAAPHGLAKVGPDTKGPWGTINFLHCAGYWYGDDTIQGFSHLHLHGTGAVDYGVLTIMPVDVMDAAHTKVAGYESKFAKKSESGVPGTYGVTLDRGNIGVEITATTHAGHHRYTWPSSATEAHVLFDLGKHLEGGSIKDADVTLVPDDKRMRGRLRSVGGMSGGFGGYDVFFEARTKQAWKSQVVWSDGKAPEAGTAAKGSGVGFAIDFDASDHQPIEVMVGVSLVSLEGAAANLAAEMPEFAFEATAAQTAAEWQKRLDVMKVTGGTDDDRNMLTAALYHAFLMPTIMSDVDGKYVGTDGAIHSEDGFKYVSDMSLWDSYRTLHPFYSLLAPTSARDAARSLVEMAKARGSFPRWPIATGESGTMIGASADVVLADAALKHVPGFDPAEAWPILRAAALDPVEPKGGRGGRDNADSYMKYQYVPAKDGGSVSRTIEYAQDDYALSQLATLLGHPEDAAALLDRSHGWRKLLDPSSGYTYPKNEDGSWAMGNDDPLNFSKHYVEANAVQTTWGAPHDLEGLIAGFGSKEKMVAKLEEVFEQGKADYDALDPEHDALGAAGMRPYFWAGNEPDIHYPWLFSLVGRPDLTQKWVRWMMLERFGPGADGLPGNDDGGTMSTWWAFAGMGLYPIVGSDRYVVAAPYFPHVELAVSDATGARGTFTIDAKDGSATNLHVQSATLNGAPLTTPTLTHADLKPGGSLTFVMGPKPSSWGK
ncbi:MAG: GH92 family glycosyl hydrolase [Polyangiales bacterium]